MAIKEGDLVLVRHGLLIYEAVVLEIENGGDGDGDAKSSDNQEPTRALSGARFLVHFPGWSTQWNEWMDKEYVMEDTPANRERMRKAKEELAVPRGMSRQNAMNTATAPSNSEGVPRLSAMISWMKSLDDSLARLDKQVMEIVRDREALAASMTQLKKRRAEAEVHKAEAEAQKAEVDAAVASNIKRIKVAEETALARKRLKDAGVARDEIDVFLPVT